MVEMAAVYVGAWGNRRRVCGCGSSHATNQVSVRCCFIYVIGPFLGYQAGIPETGTSI